MVGRPETSSVLGLDKRSRELLHDLPRLAAYPFHVRRSPGPRDIFRIGKEMPDALVDVVAEEGVRLSDLPCRTAAA